MTGASIRRPWLAELRPVGEGALDRTRLPAATIRDLVADAGAGPAGWAAELGQGMGAHIVEQVPALGVDGVAHEVLLGCEAVAVAVLAVLSGEDGLSVAPPPEVLTGPSEVVSRGIGVEEMLRSIQLGHDFAWRAVVAAVGLVVPPAEQFTETARLMDTMFRAVMELTTAMTTEFSRAHQDWWASSSAVRLQLVRGLLAGSDDSEGDEGRALGYDLTRTHISLVVWDDDPAPASTAELHATTTGLLRTAGCTSTLVLPVGRRLIWAWGSRTGPCGMGQQPHRPAAPGVRVASGLSASGLAGFRRTHAQAVEAAQIGKLSRAGGWFFDYAAVDVLAMLLHRPDLARDFVRRELGELAGPGRTTAALRSTLTCYLEADRSLETAASQLNVARNTVTYRVNRAQALRGRPISERRMELQAALRLVAEFGDAVLGPGSGSSPSHGQVGL